MCKFTQPTFEAIHVAPAVIVVVATVSLPPLSWQYSRRFFQTKFVVAFALHWIAQHTECIADS